jgi:hypothetical protein
MRPPRFNWDDPTQSVVLHTPVGMSPAQVAKARAWALKVYTQRHRNLPPGDRKEAVGKVIRYLTDNSIIAQHITGRADCEMDRILLGAR